MLVISLLKEFQLSLNRETDTRDILLTASVDGNMKSGGLVYKPVGKRLLTSQAARTRRKSILRKEITADYNTFQRHRIMTTVVLFVRCSTFCR